MNNLVPALVISFGSMVLYAFIGASLGKKKFADQPTAAAWRAFRIWWYGMAVRTGTSGLAVALLAAGVSNIALYVVIDVIGIAGAAAALWGLLTYLLYVFTGRPRASFWMGVFYALFFVAIVVSIIVFQPTGIHMGDFATAFDYANPPTGAFALVYGLALLLLISLPPVFAAIALLTLYSKVNLGQQAWWPLTIRVVGIAALFVIYWAYYPPGFIQKTFRVSPLT